MVPVPDPTAAMPDPLTELATLTDDEVRDLVTRLTRLAEVDAVDSIRSLLAEWAVTVRIRSHPDYRKNVAAFNEAIGETAAAAS
jgi:hypothetical protein